MDRYAANRAAADRAAADRYAADRAAGQVAAARPSTVAGLLLAAGAGRRMGGPKALLPVRGGEGSQAGRAVDALRDGGCARCWVVVGAQADRVRTVLRRSDADVHVVEATGWDEGMGASLRTGLAALAEQHDLAAALVFLVDTPDVTAAVVRRVLDAAAGDVSTVLARAAYGGTPGHPVLLGRQHWAAVAAQARGDQGARDYLAVRDVRLVECGDLATGRDVDTQAER